jgi:hypothetical protein
MLERVLSCGRGGVGAGRSTEGAAVIAQWDVRDEHPLTVACGCLRLCRIKGINI